MPPANLLSRSGRKVLTSKPRGAAINKRTNFDLDVDSDGDSTIDDPKPRLSQTILGAHNSLKQLLSGPSLSQPEAVTPPRMPRKRGGRPPKNAVQSTKPITSASTPISNHNDASTPISRLKEASAKLGSPESWHRRLSIHFDDIEDVEALPIPLPKRQAQAQEQPPPKRKRGRPRKNPVIATKPPHAPIESPSILPKLKPRPRKPRVAAKPPDGGYKERTLIHEFDDADDPNTRRSSYGMRGKRVLLIGNGFVGKPHSEVAPTEYYKMLDSSMPEPSRMRQLLSWCFRKTLDQAKDSSEPTGDSTARGIARVVTHELLDDLMAGQISTSWYGRRSAGANHNLSGRKILKPNPLNESNKENLEIFTTKLRQLQAERRQWNAAFSVSLAPIKGLAVDVSADSKPEVLSRHLMNRDGTEQIVDDVLGEGLVNQVHANLEQTKVAASEKLLNLVDRLYHMLHRMALGVELAGQLEENFLRELVAETVRNYITRDVAHGQLRNKDLLRGIAKLDAPSN